MAITNHDRVSKAMELLKAGLDRCSHAGALSFPENCVHAFLPTSVHVH